MLLYRNGAASGLLKRLPCVDVALGNPLKLPVVSGTVGEKRGTPLGIVWTPGLATPVPALPTPAAPRLGAPPPRLCAEASEQASHPAPQTMAPQINVRDIGFIQASLSRAMQVE
jgi:hypothetical protein